MKHFILSLLIGFNMLLSCAAVLPAAEPASSPQSATPIPFSEIGAKATADYKGDAIGITATAVGATLRTGFQKLTGTVTPEGLRLMSTEAEGGSLKLTATAVGRSSSPTISHQQSTCLPCIGTVTSTDTLVTFTRPGLIEEYSVSMDGVRQDFIVPSAPAGSGALNVELTLSAATAEAVADGAKLTLSGSGRALAYSRLHVTDASGKTLAATLAVLSPTRLVVQVEDAGAVYPIRIDPTFSDADWVSLNSGIQGANDLVRAMVVDGSGNLIVGGDFTSIGGVAANRIAKWNGSAWSALGTGMDNGVWSLAVSGSDLYAGGYFTTAGGTTVNYIAKWNGSAWSALSSGMTDAVYALAVSGGILYAGGNFGAAGGTPANYVAKWNGSAWSALGTGITSPDPVLALAVSGSDLYVGGFFSSAGGVSAYGIAKWNGSAWSALGTGLFSVYALAVSGSDLYAGGFFEAAGGMSANGIAKWNGSAWSVLGSGMGVNFPFVYALAVRGSDLYAGGNFTTAGGVTANRIAKWNGSAWSALGSGMNGNVYALAADISGHLYVGGAFSLAGTTSSPMVAKANLLPPDITVEQPAGTVLADGSASINLGTLNLGVTSTAKTFTLTNTGIASLTLGTITKDGANSGDFTVSTAGMLTTLTEGASTTFTVTFSPSASGVRSAAIHIASNVTGTKNPFDITLTGTGSSTVTPTFTTGSTVPVTANGFSATGLTLGPITLGFAPTPGQVLTLVNNTSAAAVTGTFTGLPQGSTVTTSFGGTSYGFFVSYLGGTGNDIVLIRQAPGVLDYAFTGDGVQVTPIGTSTDNALAVVVQGDGKIVAVGDSHNGSNFDFAVVRYNADGSLDTSFDTDGKVTTPIGTGDDSANAMALQSDGKIIAAGFSQNGSNKDFALARYNADGSPDNSFGTGGKATLGFNLGGSNDDVIHAIVIQPDGKIVCVGRANAASGFHQVAIARFHGFVSTGTPGQPDASFGTGGKFSFPVGSAWSYANAVALQSDGKIVVAGTVGSGTAFDFMLARVHGLAATGTPGTLDTSFDTDGKVTTSTGTVDEAHGITIQPDGKIVAAGYSSNGSNNDVALIRYLSNGATDPTFGTNGIVTTNVQVDDYGFAVAVQSDGRIVVGGSSNNPTADLLDVRYNADGSLDTTFASGGKKLITINPSADDVAYAMALQPDGNIVLAGSTVTAGGTNDFAVARVLAFPETTLITNGSFESVESFGGTSVTGFHDWGWDVASSVTTENGITPYEGSRMLKFVGTHPTSNPSPSPWCDVPQFVDLSPYAAQIAQGLVSVTATARFNRVAGNASTDTRFDVIIETHSGTVPGPVTNTNDVSLISDADPSTWELVTATSAIPSGTTHLLVGVYAYENVVNDTTGTEFAGHYADGVTVTLTIAPTVTSLAASNIGDTTATLNGTVNANTGSATVVFDYGLTTAYGSTATATPSPITGSSATSVSAALTGLQPGTLYHYRVRASNSGAISNGSDLTFTTSTVQQSWRQQYFGTTSGTGDAAPTADPNHNGIANLIEYALGGDPVGGSTGIAILPTSSISPTAHCMAFSLTRYLDRNDLTLTVQAADSLTGPWTNLARSINGAAFSVLTAGATVNETGGGNTRTVTVCDLYQTTDPAHPKRFMRLEVMAAP